MGTETAPLPEHCAPPRQNQRVATSGPLKGGPGGKAPVLFLPISREKWGPLPGRRAPGAPRPEASQEPRPPEGYAVPYRAPSVAAVYTRMGSPVSVSRAWVR